MFDTFEAFWSFLIPLLPRSALERWATIPSAHRHSPVGHAAGIHDPRSIATMITLSAFESDRGPTLVRLAEPRQVLSDHSDPGISRPARSKHLLEGTPKRGRRRRRTQGADAREVVVEAGLSCERLCRSARYWLIEGREAEEGATMGTRDAARGPEWSESSLLSLLMLMVLGLLLTAPTPAYAQQQDLLRRTRPQPAAGPGHGHARVRSPAVRFHDLSWRGASPDRVQRARRGTGHRRM
jgi:hypothetical protein